jgi:hypothetical protein
MKFLCLAYGGETAWKQLSRAEQNDLLAQDQFLRDRGDQVARLSKDTVTLRAWEGKPEVTIGPLLRLPIPLAGFSIVEANSLDEAVELVKNTPCARAKGAIEIRRIDG